MNEYTDVLYFNGNNGFAHLQSIFFFLFLLYVERNQFQWLINVCVRLSDVLTPVMVF